MTGNHFVLGLGGTGGKIIRSLRKMIFQEFRERPVEGANLTYLYVDSSDEMMALEDASWKILGTSVQLNKRSQLLIQEANLGARLSSIDNYPGIKPWIGDPEQWRDVLGSIVGVTLGGQKRRLGRFLFACKADQFRQQVQSLVKDLQESATTDVTFHVVCGLAGGTGSGSVIDAIAMLRDTYPDSKRYRIILYALLPETYPNPTWDTGNYHANGYAALLELNALSVRRFSPTDLLGIKGRLNVQDPFNGCYLFTNENENGLTVDVDKQLPSLIADFLFQKIVATRNISWPTLGRFENAENGDGTPERAPSSNNPERSKRFLTFGIKRLAVPEQEIREYLTYHFARQAALQMRFNTWSDTSGFVDEAKNEDFNELVRQKENLLRWGLSEDHLMLSTGILMEDVNNRKWKPIDTDWQEVLPNFKSVVREKPRESWLDELAALCGVRFNQDYRGVGVRNFYAAKLKARKEHAKEIRRRLELECYSEWRNGTKSLFSLSREVAALLDMLDERRGLFDERVAQWKTSEEGVGTRVKANSISWSNMGLLQKMVFGTPDSLLDAQAVALQELYVIRTRIEGGIFAKQLIEDVLGEINDLKSELDKASSTMAAAVRKYNDRLAERVNDDGRIDLREQLIRFYDPDLVRRVSAAMVRDENEQRTQTSRVRQVLVERLGDNPTFTVFNQRISQSDFIDVLDKECTKNAQIAHNNLVLNEKEKLLGVSIIDRLKERYGGDPQELRAYVTDLVGHAGNYLTFDASEVHKMGPGIPPDVQTAVSTMSVIVPRRPELADFSGKLKVAFQGARGGNVEVIESTTKPNEIALISLTNLFPLRYVKQVSFLREKYLLRLKGSNSARARLELHLEGDGAQYPQIFVPLQEEMKRDALPYLLIGKAIGLAREEVNPTTGGVSLVFVAKDQDGFDTDPIDLGKNLIDATTRITLESSDVMKVHVNQWLHVQMTLDLRASLQQSIVAEVEKVKALRGNNVSDEIYRQFLDGGRQAVKIIRPEN